MEQQKKALIEKKVKKHIRDFAAAQKKKHLEQLDNEKGIINRKCNNVFISSLNTNFVTISALSRSFDSSLGNMLEELGNDIATLSWEVRDKITDSFLLPEQKRLISDIVDRYSTNAAHPAPPSVAAYADYQYSLPADVSAVPKRSHDTDHYFYNKTTHAHRLIELKAGGDLDNKKAPAELRALLEEYFMLKNKLKQNGDTTPDIKIYFAAAYNKDGDGKPWKQNFVKKCFSDEELLIGRDYWNFVCDAPDGYDVVIQAFNKYSYIIDNALK